MGRCSLHLLDWIRGTDSRSSTDEHSGAHEITIEFRDVPQWLQRANQVKALVEEGILPHDIAQRLGLKPRSITVLYHRWYAHHGLPIPEEYQRLSCKSAAEQPVPVYQRIAAEVQRLADQGLSLQDIAAHCDVDRNTITATMKYLAQQRGERLMDGRARRKMLRIAQQKRSGEGRKGP